MSEELMVQLSEIAAKQKKWAAIPQALRSRPQWAVAGPDKAPLCVTKSSYASSTDRATWSRFDDACTLAAQRGLDIGYFLSVDDPFTCIDLDVKADTPREVVEGYHSAITSFDSYAERSRSGRGFHIWIEGNIGRGRRREGVEVYSQDRFMICTGDVVFDRPIAPRDGALAGLLASISSEPNGQELASDTHDTRRAMQIAEIARNDSSEMGRLFRGGWQNGEYSSHSEADLALVRFLARLTDSNEACWAAFLMSELGKRDKAARADYKRRTLELAVESQDVLSRERETRHRRLEANAVVLAMPVVEMVPHRQCCVALV